MLDLHTTSEIPRSFHCFTIHYRVRQTTGHDYVCAVVELTHIRVAKRTRANLALGHSLHPQTGLVYRSLLFLTTPPHWEHMLSDNRSGASNTRDVIPSLSNAQRTINRPLRSLVIFASRPERLGPSVFVECVRRASIWPFSPRAIWYFHLPSHE